MLPLTLPYSYYGVGDGAGEAAAPITALVLRAPSAGRREGARAMTSFLPHPHPLLQHRQLIQTLAERGLRSDTAPIVGSV